MARQERNSVDYFPHTVSHGKKMFYLRTKYKNDGYSVWFMFLEQLGKAEYHYLDLSDDVQLMYLSSEFMVSEETLKDIIITLVKFGDFDEDLWNNHRIIFDEKFVKSIADAYKKRNNDCISKRSLYERLGLPYPDKSNPNDGIRNLKVSGSTQRIEKDIKEKKRREEATPPSLSEVVDFFVQNDYKKETAKEAFDYYNSRKWTDSKGNDVTDWKLKMKKVWFKPENKILPAFLPTGIPRNFVA